MKLNMFIDVSKKVARDIVIVSSCGSRNGSHMI